jgi:phage terminase small subunit
VTKKRRARKGRSQGRPPNEKQKKFIEGIVEGKSDRQAALAAGYTDAYANHTAEKLWSRPQIQSYYEKLVRKVAPPERLAKRLSELIDGKVLTTKATRRTRQILDKDNEVITLEDTIAERIESVNADVSLRAVEDAAEWGGQVPTRNPPIAVQVNVSQMDRSQLLERLDQIEAEYRALTGEELGVKKG